MHRSFSLMSLSQRLVLTTCLLGVGPSLYTVQAQEVYRFNPEHRRAIDGTIRDLQAIASRFTYSGHERERYDNAMKHLSEFEERLHERGSFDKGKLDEAIGDTQSVLDHNPMDQRGREILSRDIRELRHLRTAYDHGYRYPY